MIGDWKWGAGQKNILHRATAEREGFSLSLEIYHDPDYDWGLGLDITSFRGYFTDQYEEGAIEYSPGRRNNTTYKWFVPAQSVEDLAKDVGGNPEQARAEAMRIIGENMLVAGDPESQGYIAIGVVVTASLKGVELAKASVWGIETRVSDITQDEYIHDLIEDEVAEAIGEAKKKLAELREI